MSATVIDPLNMNFYRWLLAAIILLPFVIAPISNHKSVVLNRIPALAILGILGSVLFPLMMYYAARETTATHIGIIQTLMPIMVIVLARAFFKSKIPPRAILGLAIALIGVIIVVTKGQSPYVMLNAPNYGDALMVLATMCFALYSLLMQRWPSPLPLHVELFGQATAAALIMAPLMAVETHYAPSSEALPLIAYAGVFASVVAPIAWLAGIKAMGASRVALFFNLLPVCAMGLAIGFLNEPLTASAIMGGILVITGVFLSDRAVRG